MEIVARIQAHPARERLYQDLATALSPLPVEIVVHESDPPSPWAGYQQCLTDLPDCSHLLIVQDDVIPCKNFSQAVKRVAVSNPVYPVCLFLGSLPGGTAAALTRAMKRGHPRYIPLTPAGFVPLVAVLWPKVKAEEFLTWSEGKKGMTRADDGNTAKWKQRTKQVFMVTVPSLVEHNDDIPSVKGGRGAQGESWRTALFVAEDGLQYDW